jgi:heme/copper-type cytochrome/quinol oxidase subunit 2
MIPDVHTISINRLDYSIQQKEQKKMEEEQRKTERGAGGTPPSVRKNSMLVSALLTVYPVIIVLLLITAAVQFMEKIDRSKMRSVVENFKLQMDKGNIPVETLEENGGKILSDLGAPRNVAHERLRALMLLYLSEIREKKLTAELGALKAANKELSRKLEAAGAARPQDKSAGVKK